MLLIQFQSDAGTRRVGILDGDTVRVIGGYATTLESLEFEPSLNA